MVARRMLDARAEHTPGQKVSDRASVNDGPTTHAINPFFINKTATILTKNARIVIIMSLKAKEIHD